MKVLVHVGNRLISEAMKTLLKVNGYEGAEGAESSGPEPDIILVDVTTLAPSVIARYPNAKILLLDTGLKNKEIHNILFTYRIHGVISSQTELNLFQKALQVVHEGQIWVDNATIKACIHGSGLRHKKAVAAMTRKQARQGRPG